MHNVPTQHYNAVHTDPLLVPYGTTKCCASEGPSGHVLVGQISDVEAEIRVLSIGVLRVIRAVCMFSL